MTIESFVFLIAKIGVPTIVGGIIDFAMYRSEKKKLRSWMELWWYRFQYVTWLNFGRAEVEAAINVLDSLVGARLFSRRRLGATVVLLLLLMAFAYPTALSQTQHLNVPPGYLTPVSVWNVVVTFFVSVAVSLSLTRYLSTLVLRVTQRWLWLAFLCLLLGHVLLFKFWYPIVTMAQNQLVLVEHALKFVHSTPFESLSKDWSLFSNLIGVGMRSEVDFINEYGFRVWFFRIGLGFKCAGDGCIVVAFWFEMQRLTNLVTNGARLLFAAVFLFSFVFRFAIQPLVSRFWAGIVESNKPTFTLIFGGLSSVIVAIHELVKAI